jgi:hypothetical protein
MKIQRSSGGGVHSGANSTHPLCAPMVWEVVVNVRRGLSQSGSEKEPRRVRSESTGLFYRVRESLTVVFELSRL